jgi:hypothetical protein
VKGGEILQFYHFLISSLLVGAALFLPDNAYAENNKESEKRQFEKVSVQVTSVKKEKKAVQANITSKVENSAPVEKDVELPEAATTIPGKGKEKSAKVIPIPKSSQKSAMASENIPKHAKGDSRSKVNKDEMVAGFEKAEKNIELVKNKQKSKNATNDILVDSLDNTDKEMKDKAQSGEMISTRKSNITVSKKESPVEPNAPDMLKKEEPPANKGEIPTVSQAINLTPRTNSSGEQSHDRLSNGLSTSSFLDKWFVWNIHHEMKLVQPYLSRYARMNTQWVNAPPSQPPQEAPLLKNVSRC